MKSSFCFQRPTACVSGAGAGTAKAAKQKNEKAWKNA